MSMGRTGNDAIPHKKAWPIEKRREMMRHVISELAKAGVLQGVNAPAVAQTYGVMVSEVEAEFMRHLSEGENI